MSGLYVAALPDWADGAGAVVEGWRTTHDAQMAARIEAHVTLAFAQPETARTTWADRLETICAHHAPFEILCRRVVVGTDHAGPMGYGFLVPDAGNGALHALRTALHTGALLDGLRPEVPFTPHITVARCASPVEALALCATLNGQAFALKARIARLALLHLAEDGAITALKHATLHGSVAP